ncbi:SUMF1/EgtB/PvdO family nonheme iron enzyme [Desulfobacterales bacterium HSG16]|nr:SUMF1/EgtB/PvdO family nonheme iron enzyme [Desulfobacterales bacterium HSG16]
MDSITAAIASAVQNNLVDQTGDTGKAYRHIENLILEHFGIESENELFQAIQKLKKRPESKVRLATIEEEVEYSKATQISEIINAVKEFNLSIETDTDQGSITADNINKISQTNIAVNGNVFIGSPPEDQHQKLQIYRQVLLSTSRNVPMRGIDIDAGNAESGRKAMSIDEVYVNLNTKTIVEKKGGGKKEGTGQEKEQKPLSAIESVHADSSTRHIVILGDPGSGKTTFMNHLCCCLAGHGLSPNQGWIDRISGWPPEKGEVLPVPIILRDFASSMPAKDEKTDGMHLWEFICRKLKAQNLEFVEKLIEKALEDEKVIILLDGLDEIRQGDQTKFVRDAITAFAVRYPRTRIVVTCRVLSWQNSSRQLANFRVYELAPFDKDQINGFIGAWYSELLRIGTIKTQHKSQTLTMRLQKAIRKPDLWRLAPNPLLLTVMAVVHTHKGQLPEARAALYEECVDVLLWRWEQVKSDGDEESPRIRKLLEETGMNETDLKQVLWKLAFECHGKGECSENGEDVADIDESTLIKAIASLHPGIGMDWATHVIDTIKNRAGLLLEREPGIYVFPHRTFQEYLAGSFLSSQAKFAETASKLAEENAFWREAILLAVGRLTHVTGESDRPLALVMELCPAKEADTDMAWKKTWMAGEVLVEIGTNRVKQNTAGKDLLDRVRDRLISLVTNGKLKPKERVEAGNALSRLGDIRFNAENWYLPDDENFGFIQISKGSFLMGSDEKHDKKAHKDEMPQHKVELSEYWIGKYPVTKAQFRVFVKDSKYEIDDEWEKYGEDNHPVVYVTWHDADAYCKWLTEKLEDRKWLIRLPTEAQWEKAARGDDGQTFPWGNTEEQDKMNYYETGINDTSSVGCFPGGESAYSLLDMAGNVWEWTSSLWGDDLMEPTFKYPYDPGDGREENSTGTSRVRRGGSWGNHAEYCRTAVRYRSGPGFQNSYRGFRVVCLPGQQPVEPGQPGCKQGRKA